MKTYSDDEIADYVAKVLKEMPWPGGKAPLTPARTARFIVAHVLKKKGVRLEDDNTMTHGNRVIGTFIDAIQIKDEVQWAYRVVGTKEISLGLIKIGEE